MQIFGAEFRHLGTKFSLENILSHAKRREFRPTSAPWDE